MAPNSLLGSPTPCKVLFVGGCPGPTELNEDRPLCRSARQELLLWLEWAKLPVRDTSYINIFDRVLPPATAGQHMTVGIKDATAAGIRDRRYEMLKNRYLKEQFRPALDRFREAVNVASPNIIVALGQIPLWATSGFHELRQRRGYLYQSEQGPKAIATYHPFDIVRGLHEQRKPCIADIRRAAQEADTPELVFPTRELTVDPTLADLHAWTDKLLSADLLAVDIETTLKPHRLITSIAFAPSPYEAICVPFSHNRESYWLTLDEELEAWRWVKRICESPVQKVLQNGTYDATWLLRMVDIALRGYEHDTRLAHSSLWPELRKDLGTMASLHVKERWWKHLRHGGSDDTDKRDD